MSRVWVTQAYVANAMYHVGFWELASESSSMVVISTLANQQYSFKNLILLLVLEVSYSNH